MSPVIQYANCFLLHRYPFCFLYFDSLTDITSFRSLQEAVLVKQILSVYLDPKPNQQKIKQNNLNLIMSIILKKTC